MSKARCTRCGRTTDERLWISTGLSVMGVGCSDCQAGSEASFGGECGTSLNIEYVEFVIAESALTELLARYEYIQLSERMAEARLYIRNTQLAMTKFDISLKHMRGVFTRFMLGGC